MGKATKWLMGLFGMKKDKEPMEKSTTFSSSSSTHVVKEKKRWSFSKQGRDSISVPSPDATTTWVRSYHLPQTDQQQQQQSRHAIAVAAATAAAADAAVAAAHAAVAVVRLTNQGRGTVFSGGLEILAAVKIQNFFRGYLARKALRALKGLVKLQALVRGFLVRKQAAATLYSMQALIRAQVSVRCQRARRRISKEIRSQPRRSMERYEEARNEFHSKRLSVEHAHNVLDESPKIVEIDTFSRLKSRSGSRSRRIQTPLSEFVGEDPYYYYPTVSSPLPCRVHGRLSIPESKQLQDFEWAYNECRGAYTTQSTPRFSNSWRGNAPPTPARSVCGDSLFRQDSNFPSYMANTQSFCAKLRSQSAPKQRPEEVINAAVAAAAAASSKKRMSLNEMMASRNSFSGIRMNRTSSAQFHEDLNS